MAHDVFISYSSKDKAVADAVTAYLEGAGVRCWIAPRDIVPGRDWGEAIIEAIEGSRVMVLVFSGNANASPQIKREVERAVNKGVALVPLRIEDVPPSKSLEYFISTPHWLDAMNPPLEAHLRQLVATVRAIAGVGEVGEARVVEYQAPRAPDRHRDHVWVAVAAGAAIALVLAIVIVRFARSARPVAVATPATAPVVAPAAPAPVVVTPRARAKADEAAETVADIEKMEARVAAARKIVGKDGRALTDEDAQRLREGIDFSNTDQAVRLNVYWNDFERVPGMTALGAKEADVRGFIEAVKEAKAAGDRMVGQVEWAALVNRLAGAAKRYAVARSEEGEAEAVKAAVGASAAEFEARVRMACVAGVVVLRQMGEAAPADAGERMKKLEIVQVGNLASGDGAVAEAGKRKGAVEAAAADVARVEEGKEARRRKVVEGLLAGVPAEVRPGAGDAEGKFVEGVRKLRAGGKVKEALTLLAAMAEIHTEHDAKAEEYYTVAAEYTRRGGELPAGGGLYVYELVGHGQYTNDGIFVGDVILSYNGKAVTEIKELTEAVKEGGRQAAQVELVRWDGKGKFVRATLTLRDGEVGGAVKGI